MALQPALEIVLVSDYLTHLLCPPRAFARQQYILPQASFPIDDISHTGSLPDSAKQKQIHGEVPKQPEEKSSHDGDY